MESRRRERTTPAAFGPWQLVADEKTDPNLAFTGEVAKSLDLDYPILSDPSRKTAKDYGLVADDKGNAKRVTFYISKEGKISFIDKMVKTEAHGTDIAAKLKELGVPKAEKK